MKKPVFDYKLKRKYEFDDTILPENRKFSDLYYGKTILKYLQEAVCSHKKILIYGDYDADGIIATYILFASLNRLSPGNINWFINNRFDDGYNITVESMKKCLNQFPDTQVLITCDNGINAVDAVNYAMELGITVLVTDHHIQTKCLRKDCPAVDEKSIKQIDLDTKAGIEVEEFCGAELSRRLITELYEKLEMTDSHKDFLDSLYAYAGFATITDVVPMNPSNHALGRQGLMIIQRNEGFWRLLREEVFADDLENGREREIHWDTIGFYYGPMINASGRMSGEAKNAIEMLLSYDTGNEQLCRTAIKELIKLNEKRKKLCEHDDKLAFSLIEKNGYSRDNFILLYDENFSEGVNGLTAAHISEKYKVPCAVLSPVKNNPKVFKGSARSVEGFNLVDHLTAHGDLIRAGGHAMAAGLSIDKKDLKKVRSLLLKDSEDFKAPPIPTPDFSYHISELSMGIVARHKELIANLEPFGPGFEAPKIEFTGETYALKAIKKKDTDELVHASFPLGRSMDNYAVDAYWWNHLREAETWFENADIVRTDTDRYKNQRNWRVFCCFGKAEKNEYTNKNGKTKVSIQITVDNLI